MAFTKITNTELSSRGASTLPDQPTISATALKAEFDAPAKVIVAPKVNNLIDELEATTASASLGAVAPTGRTGATVQALINDISTDLATAESTLSTVSAEAHTHTNKALLDTYAQTEADLADAVTKKHTHSNKAVIDKFSEVGGNPYYDGNPIGGGGGTSDYTALSNLPQINSVTLTGNKSSSDLGLMPATTLATIATTGNLSDANQDSTHRVVTDAEKTTWNGKVDDAYKTIKVGSTEMSASGEGTFEIKAGSNVTLTAGTNSVTISSSGGGGTSTGDMLASEYDSDYTIKNASSSGNGIKDYVASAISGKANTADLATVATSGAYSDLSGKPTLATVATSGSYADLSNKPTVDQAYNAVSQNAQSGVAVASAISTKADASSVPDALADLTTDVQISTPSSDQVLKYNGTKWVNGVAPAGGHTMLPTPSSSLTETAIVQAVNDGVTEGGENDDVASLNTIGTWSNNYNKRFIIQATALNPISTTGIGTWQDNLSSPTKADEQGWGWVEIPALSGIGSNYNVDVILSYDPATCSVPVALGGYIIDDSTNMMCIKFANEISPSDTETIAVGVEIVVTRTAPSIIAP